MNCKFCIVGTTENRIEDFVSDFVYCLNCVFMYQAKIIGTVLSGQFASQNDIMESTNVDPCMWRIQPPSNGHGGIKSTTLICKKQ